MIDSMYLVLDDLKNCFGIVSIDSSHKWNVIVIVILSNLAPSNGGGAQKHPRMSGISRPASSPTTPP